MRDRHGNALNSFGRGTPAPALATSSHSPQLDEVASFKSLGDIVSGIVQRLAVDRLKRAAETMKSA